MTLTPLSDWRRMLHQMPEISGDEAQTAAAVATRLRALQPDDLATGIGGHGVVAVFRGASPKVRVLLRCELDGLPITETNTFDHRSRIKGQGHLCGHDGHMAMVMGVAERLSAARVDGVEAVLLFQPAEETGAGAKAVIKDTKFAPYLPDFAVSLHNLPGAPLAQVQVKPGAFACASRGLKIRLIGKTAHASQPETGVSPALAVADIIQAAAGLAGDGAESGVPRQMVTLTHAKLGEPTFGVAPGDAEIRMTLRTISDNDMADLCDRATATCAAIAHQHRLAVDFSYDDIFTASANDPGLVQTIVLAAQHTGADCIAQPAPMRWSEDFGRFGQLCPSAMFLIGAGETCPALHNPDYDFPDQIIPTGVDLFYAVLQGLAR